MFENPSRGRQARNFTTNAPKILDLKSSSEQILSRKLPLGAPAPTYCRALLSERLEQAIAKLAASAREEWAEQKWFTGPFFSRAGGSATKISPEPDGVAGRLSSHLQA